MVLQISFLQDDGRLNRIWSGASSTAMYLLTINGETACDEAGNLMQQIFLYTGLDRREAMFASVLCAVSPMPFGCMSIFSPEIRNSTLSE